MNFRRLGPALALSFLATISLIGQSADFYSLELIKSGQKGYGKTVFQGTRVETFQVEILGVLENVGPKQNLILARLAGEPIDSTGVFAGMSGSPVYIEDKLIGAVAFSFPIVKAKPVEMRVDKIKKTSRLDLTTCQE